eukprot:304834-Rhodomonas_salina.2
MSTDLAYSLGTGLAYGPMRRAVLTERMVSSRRSTGTTLAHCASAPSMARYPAPTTSPCMRWY